MKIIRTDNFDRDTVDDLLIAERVNEYYGQLMTKSLIEQLSGDNSPHYFKLVSNDYKLHIWEP